MIKSLEESVRVWAHVGVAVVVAVVLSLITGFAPPASANTTTWEQVGMAIDGDVANNRSGNAVALSADGSRVVIGASNSSRNGQSMIGQVRVFERSGGNWTQIGSSIHGEAALDEMGHSVAISADGDVIAVGARGHDSNTNNGSGLVRVFTLIGAVWTRVGNDITGNASGDVLGTSVAISADGSRIVVGAPDEGTTRGYAQIYDLVGNTWTQAGADIQGAAGDRLGGSVSMSLDGQRVAVAARGYEIGGQPSGQVRVFQWNSNSSTWNQVGSGINGTAGVAGGFGWAVSISGDGSRVAAAAMFESVNGMSSAGKVRAFEFVGNTWTQVGQDLNGLAANDSVGRSLSLTRSGNRLAVGALGNRGNGSGAGYVRVYDLVGNTWTQVGSDLQGDGPSNSFGTATSMSGDGLHLAVGANGNDNVNGVDAGHTRVFRAVQPAPSSASVDSANAGAAQLVTAPFSVSYRTGNKRVTLRWSAVPGAASYAVTQANGSQVCATTSTSCVVNRLRNGRAYNYNVFAVHANGARSITSIQVSARPGFQVRSTTVNARRTVSLSSIVTTPSKGRKTWTVTSGRCRISGTRLVAPTKKGSCKLRLSTTRSGAYGAMSTTITVTVR